MLDLETLLKEEWELLLLIVALIVLALLLMSGIAASERHAASGGESGSGSADFTHDLSAAIAALSSSRDLTLQRNPFFFELPEPAKKAPVTEPKTTSTVVATDQTPTEAQVEPSENTQEVEEVSQQPRYSLQPARLTFVYSQMDSTGKNTALIKIQSVQQNAEVFRLYFEIGRAHV